MADVIVHLHGPPAGFQLAGSLRAEPGPVDIGRAQAGFGEPGRCGGRFSLVVPARETQEEAVAGLGPEMGEAELGEFLAGIFLSGQIALDFERSVRGIHHRNGVPAGVKRKVVFAIAGKGPRHQPLVAVGCAERLQEELDRSGVGGLDLYFQMKGWFRPEGGHWSILGFAGGGCGRGADPNVCGAALEEAIEDARLSGGEKSGGGVLAGMRVGTAARSVEIPSLRGFLPERNLHLVEFPFEVLHAGAQDSTAVLGSAPRERVHTPFAGKLAAVVQDEVVKALLPLIAEQEVANGGGGGHSQECSWEWARGN